MDVHRILPIFPALLLAACTTVKGPHADRHVGAIQHVRTTAYTQTEPGGWHNGCGGILCGDGKDGKARSAASDWSWLPVGTRFQILETGEIRQIDDYGSALIGTHTIDLFKTSRAKMRAWGVRFVDIKILAWGSSALSLEILSPRVHNPHVARMVASLRQQTPAMPAKFKKINDEPRPAISRLLVARPD